MSSTNPRSPRSQLLDPQRQPPAVCTTVAQYHVNISLFLFAVLCCRTDGSRRRIPAAKYTFLSNQELSVKVVLVVYGAYNYAPRGDILRFLNV